MSQPSQSYVRNCLLSSLAPDDYALLRPHLIAVPLDRGEVLIESGEVSRHAFFPERGIGATVVRTSDGSAVQTGIFGRDGMGCAATVLGDDHPTQETLVQIAGNGYRVEVAVLSAAMEKAPGLRRALLRYVQTMVTQASFTALSNAVQSVEQRCARWLLMCHDRIDGDDIAITHDSLSIMLAVQRPSVTGALHLLEGNRVIRARRGQVTVLDREALVALSDGAYGVPEEEYRRLIGSFTTKGSAV